MQNTQNNLKPVIKWAGGKRQIIPEILRFAPDNFNVYYEPFAGSLALFIALHNAGKLSVSVISDTNPDIYNLYKMVRDYPNDLLEELQNLAFGNNRSDYYAAREAFNSSDCSGVVRASLFLYLNRHSYNGLYRVNQSGRFNVPFGSYSMTSLPGEKEIMLLSAALKNCRIERKDFAEAVEAAKENDFVYFDPPYMPLNKTSSFTDYTASGFSYEDQVRLSLAAKNLDKRGVQVMISNADIDAVRELYQSFHFHTVQARRNINSNGRGRGKISELIICNCAHDTGKQSNF
ncbi:MAG: DNA adenine methylase [Thermoplasmataceae archaeon]